MRESSKEDLEEFHSLKNQISSLEDDINFSKSKLESIEKIELVSNEDNRLINKLSLSSLGEISIWLNNKHFVSTIDFIKKEFREMISEMEKDLNEKKNRCEELRYNITGKFK